MEQQRQDNINIYLQDKKKYIQQLLIIVTVIVGVYAFFRWFQGDTHKDYKQLYDQLDQSNKQLIEKNEKLQLSIDSIRKQRNQAFIERDIVLEVLKLRPQQIDQTIKDYETIYSNIDNASLDSIAMFLGSYRFDSSNPFDRSSSLIQP